MNFQWEFEPLYPLPLWIRHWGNVSQHVRYIDGMWWCCGEQGVPINESYCGETEQNGPLVGSVAVESSPVLSFSDTQLTSVAAASVNGHTIIYLGTHHGHLKKVGDLSIITLDKANNLFLRLGR